MKNLNWIALLLLLTKLSAQSSYVFRGGELTIGEQMSAEKHFGSYDIIAADSSIFQINQGKQNNELIVAKYNLQTLAPINEQNLELEYKNNKLNFLHFSMFGGELTAFADFYNQKDSKRYVFAQVFDRQTLTLKPTLKKVAESIPIPGVTQLRQSNFIFKYSEDKSVLAIITQSYFGRRELASVNISTINSNCDIIWSKTVQLAHHKTAFEAKDYCVNSQGDVFIIGFFPKKQRAKDKNSYKVLRYNADGSQQEYDIKIADKSIKTLNSYIADNGMLVCAGFYGNNKSKGINGIFYASLDLKTNQLAKESLRSFDTKSLSFTTPDKKLKGYKQREARGKGIKLNKYVFREFVRRSDGGAVLIGEQFFTETTSSGSQKSSYSRTTYHYYNILVANISPKGEIEWVNIIPKRQICGSRSEGSFLFTAQKDKLYFIFNDDARNIPFDKNRKVIIAGIKDENNIVSIVGIDVHGNQERMELSRWVDTESIISAKASAQISASEVVLLAIPTKKTSRKVGLQRLTFK